MVAQASCYCGTVQAMIDPAGASALHCHCSQCRRLSGAAFSTWLNLPLTGFRLESDAGDLTEFAVTARVARYFCRHCGSHVYSTDSREAGIVGLPLGIVSGTDLPAPAKHYFFDSGVPWCDVAPDAHKAGGPTGFEPIK